MTTTSRRKFTLEEVTEFLLGNAPLDGVWFGERHPKEVGAFWWRAYLRQVIPERTELRSGKGRRK